MSFYSWQNIQDNTNDFGSQIAKNAKNFACRLWRDYPKNFVGDNPVANPIRQFWNNLCDEEPPEVPPPPPFIGGQCQVRYSIQYQTALISGGTLSGWSSTFTYSNAGIVGKILNIQLVVIDQVDEDLSHWSFDGNGENPYINTRNKQYKFRITNESNTTDFTIATAFGLRFIGLTRFDGLPDNCGDLPTDYPDTPAPEPGDEIYNTNYEGDTTNNLTFPLVWNDIDFSIPLKFDFEVGNVDVNFDGVNVNFDIDNNWKLNPPKNDINKEFNDFKTKFENTFYLPDLEDLEEETDEDIVEKEETDPTIEAVLVDVIALPKKGKTIVLPNPADNTFFAGYFSWMNGDYRAPEEPVRKSKNFFVKPQWATGYRVYTVNLARISVSTFKSP